MGPHGPGAGSTGGPGTEGAGGPGIDGAGGPGAQGAGGGLGAEDRIRALSGEVIGLLIARGDTVAVAESLTGGLLAATLTAVPGASATFRGGVVAYATDLKATLLGVPSELLHRHGAIHPSVAAAMADGACRRLGTSVAAATTGVAGPDPADGQPVGTVYIAVSAGGRTTARALALTGDRDRIRAATVEQSLGLLLSVLREDGI
jgi:nicotinamide-nucleotide amidase